MTTGRLFGTLALIMACVACNRFGHYTLESPEYGFCVTFPEKPSKLSDKNREGLPKHLWTVYRPDRKDFYSAQATSYKEALPTEGWLPGRAVGDLVGIQFLEGSSLERNLSDCQRQTSQKPTSGPCRKDSFELRNFWFTRYTSVAGKSGGMICSTCRLTAVFIF